MIVNHPDESLGARAREGSPATEARRTLVDTTTPEPEDTGKTFAELMAERGRPITAEGRARARRMLDEAAARRDHEARAALRARLDAL